MKYDIAGVIIQPFHSNVLFEGNNLNHDENNTLTGRIIDRYGRSSIAGSLDLSLGEMSFDKIYDLGRKVVIKYRFKKQGPLWLGEYGFDGSFQGEAMCDLHEHGKKSEVDFEELTRQLDLSYSGTEKWASGLIQGMIEEGYLEEFKDPETGIVYVKPTDLFKE